MVSLRRATAADEYRTMRWRTAPCHEEAVRPRISRLPLGLDPEDVNSDVDVVEIDQAELVDIVAATTTPVVATATATATGARGYEIEFLIRQLDRVSEIGHLLHVGLLSVFDVSGGI
jgi:hypothetical protein